MNDKKTLFKQYADKTERLKKMKKTMMKVKKWKWHTAKYGDPYSEFVLCIYPSKVHTHSSEHTHTVNTHQSSGQPFMLRRPGSSWGFSALLEGTSSWYWRWRECCTLTPLTDNVQCSLHLQYLQYFNAKWRRIWRQRWWKWLRRKYIYILNDDTQYAYNQMYARCKESMLQLFKFYTCQHKECISTMLAHAPNEK